MKFFRLTALMILTLSLAVTLQLKAQENNNFEISKNLDIYATLLMELDKNYADQINVGELTETAIDAMLESLDPYTNYIPESNAEDYKLMTTGQYGGIGALIHKQGDYVVISEPYEGFPAQKAGLHPGDKILEINGKSMQGKDSEEVSEILERPTGSRTQDPCATLWLDRTYNGDGDTGRDPDPQYPILWSFTWRNSLYQTHELYTKCRQ